MKNVGIITGLFLSLFLIAACQTGYEQGGEEQAEARQNQSEQQQEYTIATGEVAETFRQMVKDFNRMDAEALWSHSADTVTMRMPNGMTVPMTQADMAGMFSSMDSVRWEMKAVYPIQVAGTNRVRVLADSEEFFYGKDGTVKKVNLMEEFTFEDGQMVRVRQWDAAMAPEGGDGSM